MEFIYTYSEINTIIKKIWEQYCTNKIWAFNANMGSGKTTFIHQLCQLLQVNDKVSSPTFSIINEYDSPLAGKIFHMDWYRLKGEEEAMAAGVEDVLNSNHYCFIEWPNIAESLLPIPYLNIEINIISELERKININIIK